MATCRDQAASAGRGSPGLQTASMDRGRGLRVLLVGLLVLAPIGCGGIAPVRSFRAAQYYAEGTRALEASDGPRAIEALEQAASLMPEASEIQNHLGLAYWSVEREADALRSLERAVLLDCANEAARSNLERLREARASLAGSVGDAVSGPEADSSGRSEATSGSGEAMGDSMATRSRADGG